MEIHERYSADSDYGDGLENFALQSTVSCRDAGCI
jgi:hypothetical protein